jgi:hypothetical protein
MEEADDQRQFFEDLAATARQSVEQIRGVEENCYDAANWAMWPLPWLTCKRAIAGLHRATLRKWLCLRA